MTKACARCGTRFPAERLDVCPVCLLEAPLMPPRLGESLELLEQVGRGGMGSVYKARHLRLNRIVAVKFLPEDKASDPDLKRRLEREARALAMLDHPNVVRVYDLGREGNQSYIVMEFVEGSPLASHLPLSLERTLDVMLQVAEGLAYAHAKGLVHRDIKPDNILIAADGKVKLSDFGLARVGHGVAGWKVTASDRLAGTPAYMAPEAFSGADPDPRMDVYSLGVVLYESLTGRLPTGERRALPEPIEVILGRSLASEPNERYPSANALREDLAAALRRLPSMERALHQEPAEMVAEEKNWLRGVALIQTLATAVVLWALVLSVTPKVIEPGELRPLVMLATETLRDGRLVSRARFETWPTLAAVGTLGLAFLSYGLLRRHWRREGLDQADAAPATRTRRPVRGSLSVFACGLVAIFVYGVRKLLDARGYPWATTYAPIIGGPLEIAAVYFLWVTVLEARRTSRPLSREPLLWLGLVLTLIPPVIELSTYLIDWTPSISSWGPTPTLASRLAGVRAALGLRAP